MTWREIQEIIGKMPEDQLDNNAEAFSSLQGPLDVSVEISDEALYYVPDMGYGLVGEQDIEPEELTECVKVYDKGNYYLWIG